MWLWIGYLFIKQEYEEKILLLEWRHLMKKLKSKDDSESDDDEKPPPASG